MSLRCKPGDMARQVIALIPQNAGAICEVLELHSKVGPWGPDWIVKPAWPTLGIFPDGRIEYSGGLYLAPDAWLRPIRPSDLEDDASTDRSEPSPTPLPVLLPQEVVS